MAAKQTDEGNLPQAVRSVLRQKAFLEGPLPSCQMQHALFSFGEIGECFQKAQRNGLDGGGGDVGLHAGPLGEQSIKPP